MYVYRRISKIILLLVAIHCGVGAVSAAERTAVVLSPTTPWTMDYAEKECRLVRSFGEGDQQIVLRIARGTSPTLVDMMVAGPSVPNHQSPFMVKMKIEPTSVTREFSGYTQKLEAQKLVLLRWYDADLFIYSTNGEIDNLLISDAGRLSITLKIGGMRKAFAALAKCHGELIAAHGGPLTSTQTLGSPPRVIGQVGNWLSTDDYPKDSLRKGQGGLTVFALDVGETGTVSGCRVVISNGIKDLDDQACTLLLKRAKFAPATNAAGEPIRSTFLSRINWRSYR
jgi:TonB family protein